LDVEDVPVRVNGGRSTAVMTAGHFKVFNWLNLSFKLTWNGSLVLLSASPFGNLSGHKHDLQSDEVSLLNNINTSISKGRFLMNTIIQHMTNLT
jgi:hypothetical protein